MADDGTKKSVEFTPALLDGVIAGADAQAKEGDLNGALEKLLALEKRARSAGESVPTGRVAVAIIRLCWETHDLKQLNAHLLIVAKRRAQLKQVIVDIVQEAMKFIDSIAVKEDRLELISTLRTVTDGKIFVEVERARLTLMLAKMKEAEGNVAEASEVLQEITIETFGSMEKREKAEFLLEQVRLTGATKDWIKMSILANKMNKKVLDEAGFEDIRLKYYDMMIVLHQARHESLSLCKDFQAVLMTRGIGSDPAKWRPALESAIVYLCLSPFDNEVSDLLHRLKSDKRTEELPSFRALLVYLTTHELVPWPLPAPHHDAIRAHPAFSVVLETGTVGTGGRHDHDSSITRSSATSGGLQQVSSLVRKEDEARSQWWPLLHKRVAQHNIRVMAKWYDRVSTSRLAGLLGLDAVTAEASVSELVSDGVLYGKIDRPAGVVVFQRPRPSAEVLSDYSADVEAVLALVEKTTHLIRKEYMVHGVAPPSFVR